MILSNFKKYRGEQEKLTGEPKEVKSESKIYSYIIEISRENVKNNNYLFSIYRYCEDIHKLMATLETDLTHEGFYFIAQACQYLNISHINNLQYFPSSIETTLCDKITISDINNKISIAEKIKFVEIKQEIKKV